MRQPIDHHRAAIAALGLIGPEHEVVEQQLPAALEDIYERRLPARGLQDVVLLDPHARQPPAFGGERVTGSGALLLLRPSPPRAARPSSRRGHSGRLLPSSFFPPRP